VSFERVRIKGGILREFCENFERIRDSYLNEGMKKERG